MMRVAHISTSALHGGAGRAACRLHEAMVAAGVDSHLLTGDTDQELSAAGIPAAHGVPQGLTLRSRTERARTLLAARAKGRVFTSGAVTSRSVRRHVRDLAPDVINLHWMGAGFLGVRDLLKLDAPMVWTLCDMWPITGGCHYAGDCDGYLHNCGNCPVLGQRAERDLSRRVWQSKAQVMHSRPDMAFVAKSSWMAAAASVAPLTQGRPVVCIPNGVDADFWFAQDRQSARRRLGLESDRPTFAFVADSIFDPRKGFDLAKRVAQQVADDLGDSDFLVVGDGVLPDAFQADIGSQRLHVTALGKVHDSELLRSVYSAADVTLLTSREENLANVALESLACGTPVAAFAIGGNADVVQSGVTGSLVPPFDTAQMASDTATLVGESQSRGAARAFVVERFSWTTVVSQYLDLYHTVESA